VFADVGRGLVEAGVFAWHLSGGLPLAALYAAVAVIEVGGCFANPARRALVPLVAADSDLTAANGLVGTTGYGAFVLGPVVAAVLLGVGGLGAFFAFGACAYLLSAVLMSVLSRRLSEQPAASRPTPQVAFSLLRAGANDLWAFARVLRSSRQLLLLFPLSASAVVFYTWAWQIGIVVKSHQLSPASTETYTVLMAVFASSVVITGLLVPWWRQRLGLRDYLVALVVWGVGLAGIGELRSETGVVIMVVVMGAGVSIGSQTRLYLLQAEVPRSMIARAFGAYSVTMYAANALGLAVIGALASTGTHLNTIFLVGAAGIIGSALAGSFAWKLATVRTSRRTLSNVEKATARKTIRDGCGSTRGSPLHSPSLVR
jgi:MFS family permease